MSRIGKTLDFYFQPVHVVYAFWAMYWGLNGLDKFMDGLWPPREECFFVSSAGSIAGSGRVTDCGWFGASRHDQISSYFAKLFPDNIVEIIAPPVLYGTGIFEIVLGALFAYMLVKAIWGRGEASHAVHRFAFMGSILVFFVFSTGDILFGDRTELWEHATFMILIVATFGIYVYRNQLRQQALGDVYSRIEEMDETINTRLYGDLMNRMSTMEARIEAEPAEPAS
ncbi:MAG: hypothetical protein MJB57_09845 [Gemmatimonadetes bacterium]|nr:hypothetical protein [Gemmatimonadota bacterium]